MALVARASSNGGTFTPAPEGSHAAVCVDVIDYGMVESTWQGQVKQKHRMAVAFQIDEQTPDGKPYIVRWYGTLTLDERGKLRPFLEQWRGKKFTPDELKDGFDVEKLIGAPALIQVVHNAKGDAVYADIGGIMKLPKGMGAPTPWSEYIRVKDRPKDTNGNGHAPVQQMQTAPSIDEIAEEEDDLPF